VAFWVLIIIFLNGVISYAYSVSVADETTNLWAMFAVTYVFMAGVTQAGVVFSAIMRLTKSKWGMHFARLGEILTLSFIPVAVVMFFVIYAGGLDHLFYWAPGFNSTGHAVEHISPWLGKERFLWRSIVTIVPFYVVSYLYFSAGRVLDSGVETSYDALKRVKVLAAFVLGIYIILNTNIAWDFGMTIVPHWESSVFAPFYWCGNLLLGTAFLFMIATRFIPREPGAGMNRGYLDSIGKMFTGLVLLWIYMFWSQHMVLWYGNLPHRMAPVFDQMKGNFTDIFAVMILTIFILPLIALVFKRTKLSGSALFIVAGLICIGVWISRYLMIIPVFSDGSEAIIATWSGISLIFGGVASALLSLIFFLRLFPGVKVVSK
jgi:hypothetical protein